MSGLAAIASPAAAGLDVAGSALGAIGTLMGGNASADAANQQARYERLAAGVKAQGLRQQGTQELAIGGRQEAESGLQKDLALSKAKSISAASGAGATDTTVQQLETGIEQTGEYNKLMEGFNAVNRQQGFENQAQNALNEGENTAAVLRYQAAVGRRKAQQSAIGTILTGSGSAFQKFIPRTSLEDFIPKAG